MRTEESLPKYCYFCGSKVRKIGPYKKYHFDSQTGEKKEGGEYIDLECSGLFCFAEARYTFYKESGWNWLVGNI